MHRLLLAALSLAFLSPSARGGDDPSPAELAAQVRQLQSRLAQLEARRQSLIDPQIVDDTVKRVLDDADRRSRLMQIDAGLTAGFANGKFFISSADGDWSFMPGVLMQFRSVTNLNTGNASGGDNAENGFEVRRMKLIASGNAITTRLTYYFQWESNRDSGSVGLEDAFVRYDLGNNLSLKGGQYYDPWIKEQNIGDSKQLAAERSLLNALIGGGETFRVQGISLINETGRYRGEVMFNDGANSLNTPFQDDTGGNAFVGGGSNWAGSARFDWFFSGNGKQAEDFTALGGQNDLLVVGAGAAYNESGDNKTLFHTVDVQWENDGGLGVYAALVGVSRDFGTPGTTVPAGNFYDWGLLVQGGYLLSDKWELFARYDFTKLDDDALAAGAENNLHEITIGSNYYFYRHNVKFTIDGVWLPNGSPVPATGLGVLVGDDDQFILRAQLQLAL